MITTGFSGRHLGRLAASHFYDAADPRRTPVVFRGPALVVGGSTTAPSNRARLPPFRDGRGSHASSSSAGDGAMLILPAAPVESATNTPAPPRRRGTSAPPACRSPRCAAGPPGAHGYLLEDAPQASNARVTWSHPTPRRHLLPG
jgi:hypothetical protein